TSAMRSAPPPTPPFGARSTPARTRPSRTPSAASRRHSGRARWPRSTPHRDAWPARGQAPLGGLGPRRAAEAPECLELTQGEAPPIAGVGLPDIDQHVDDAADLLEHRHGGTGVGV